MGDRRLIGGLGGGGRFRRLRGLGILMEAAGGCVKSRRRVGCGGFYGGWLTAVALFVLQRHGEVCLLAGGVDALDVEHRLLARGGFLYGFLEVVDGGDGSVVHLLDDEASADSCGL